MIPLETLRRYSLFAELNPSFLDELSSIAQDKTAENGEWLFHEGDAADALYLISRGSVELKLRLDDKRNIYATLSMLHAGDALGWSAIVKPYIYSLGATASGDTHLLRFDGESLRILLEKHPQQGYILMRGIAQAMGSRVSVLSEHAPRLTWRFIISMVLTLTGIVTGILVLLLGISILFGLVGGYSGAVQAIPVALFCVIFPAAFLFLARIIYPALSRNSSLSKDEYSPESHQEMVHRTPLP